MFVHQSEVLVVPSYVYWVQLKLNENEETGKRWFVIRRAFSYDDD